MPTPRPTMPRRRPRGLSAAALAAAACVAAVAGPAAAQSRAASSVDPRIDAATGRDLRVWPPDLLFDYQHMLLEVDFPDMATAVIHARSTLEFTPIGSPRSTLRLDAGPAMTFSSVSIDGAPLDFTHADSKLTVTLPRVYAPGERIVLTMEYDAERPGGRGAGLTFSKDDPSTPEFDPMCHAQGQPQSNHLWFPCHDFPNDRLATEVIATVPAGYTAISNGRLLEVRKNGGQDGERWRFHWKQDLPHPNYLVTLVVGKFDIVDVGGPESARPGLWMPVYGPLGSAEVLRRNFGNTPDMVAFFEEILDEPFPWDKFANIICRDFAAGAMENTSAVTWASFAATAPLGAVEGVNAHELIHQWFGDLLTCKSWEHLWLNEGWATYGESMWAEETRGEAGYQRSIARNAGQIRGLARGSRPASTGMATNLYADPDERFYAADNPYQKGGWILHALRSRLGDDVFWTGVRAYIDRHKFGHVETDDFRIALEEASGQSLERFFDQFVTRPGVPRLNIDLAWDDAASTLTVAMEQTQTIDADNPAYALSLPLLVDYGEGEYEYIWMDIDARRAESTFTLDRKPTKVVADPAATVPAAPRITSELSMLVDQLETGPTIYAQTLAAEALAHRGGPDAARALALAAAGLTTDPLVRSSAARSLASLGAHELHAATQAFARIMASPTLASASER